MKHIVIVHTGGGIKYSAKIEQSIHWIAERRGLEIEIHLVPAIGRRVHELLEILPMENTVIHSRAAHPNAPFMAVLETAELEGYRVINHPFVLKLTSDKGACAKRLQELFPHPRTWIVNKAGILPWGILPWVIQTQILDHKEMILKPIISNGQGKFVRKVSAIDLVLGAGDWADLPGDQVVIQECVPYTAIYRVICIGGVAMPYAFVDRPEFHPAEWKVSVCLNKLQRFVPHPPPELLNLAERVQYYIGGEINFIDIFETEPGEFVLSEINTACSLFIHERLARAVGRADWNIHYRIAKYLVDQLYEEV